MNLISETDPTLKTSVINQPINWLDLGNILPKMHKLMNENYGVGLAAPQVGISQPFFITDGSNGLPKFVGNPVIEKISDQIQRDFESCLSLAGLRLMIPRYQKVAMQFEDQNQNKIEIFLEGFAARVVQHEIDHLHGILIVDRAAKLSLKMALAKRNKLLESKNSS